MTVSTQLALSLVTVMAACAAEADLVVEPGEAEVAIGKADSVAGGAELKVTIDSSQIARARSRLALANDKSQSRNIWFYDTPSLGLLNGGVILRAREIDGAVDDSTIKLRPFTLAQLAPDYRKLDGLKCEIDRSTAAASSACSLKVPQGNDEIDDVADGKRDIIQLFSSAQEALYARYGDGIGWDALAPLGPIPARVWTVHTKKLPSALTAELWYVPNAGEVLELSLKVDADDADDALADLLDFVADRELDLAAEQESKTRRALEALLAH